MGTRIPSHQLSSGLYVSGRPDSQKDQRPPTMSSRAVPYTGGDIKHSGELGKMFDIQIPPTSTSSQPNSGSISRSGPNSGPIGSKNPSGPILKKNTSSGPLTPLQPTGLITSGPLGSSVGRRSGQLEPPPGKAVYGPAVTNLGEGKGGGGMGFGVSKAVMWVVAVAAVMGVVVGAFLTVAVKKPVILVAVIGVLAPAVIVVTWNWGWRRRGLLGYWSKYPDAELRGAVDGQFVKVTGVVTCGSIPLESSFQRVPRCVYASTELYEYRGCGGKSAYPKHRFFSWGCRHAEKYVADFYISDFQSGLRALVKAGYGAKVSVFVEPTTVVDVTKKNHESSPSFLRWLSDRSLSSDDRIMRLKEGYIKEGSTVSVIGTVRRHDTVLMIVPPAKPVSTLCQWFRCLLPTYCEGLILMCDESQTADVIAV